LCAGAAPDQLRDGFAQRDTAAAGKRLGGDQSVFSEVEGGAHKGIIASN
jgi:hypothetical protein